MESSNEYIIPQFKESTPQWYTNSFHGEDPVTDFSIESKPFHLLEMIEYPETFYKREPLRCGVRISFENDTFLVVLPDLDDVSDGKGKHPKITDSHQSLRSCIVHFVSS
jgi:hypothetical protein